MCVVYIRDGADGLGLSACEMREQDRGIKVGGEMDWDGFSVCFCVSKREEKGSRTFLLTC